MSSLVTAGCSPRPSWGSRWSPLVLADMTEAERRAYIIADNRLAECAGWDEERLASELAAIASLEGALDLALTEFDGGALEKLLELAAAGPVGPDEVPEIDTSQPAVSRTGDVWVLGRHRLIVGDARDPAVFEKLMAGELAQMAISDPPYNVPIEGHVCGLGKVKHAEFAMASGEMSEAEFESFLATTLGNLAKFGRDGSIHYVFMDWRHMNEILVAKRLRRSGAGGDPPLNLTCRRRTLRDGFHSPRPKASFLRRCIR